MFINSLTDLAIILQSALNVSVSGTLESISEAVIALVEEQKETEKKLEEMEMETETDHDNLLDEMSELKSVYNQKIETLLDKVEKKTGKRFNSRGDVILETVTTSEPANPTGKSIGLKPAYGRDYRSKKLALKAFEAGDDFIITDITHQYSGKPVNREQLKADGYTQVSIRYFKNRRQVITVID